MIKVTSQIKLHNAQIKRLTQVSITALEQTAEALHTRTVQAQVIPRDTGALQNESTFVDYSQSAKGEVSIVSSTPYARRLYFHPEYNFHQEPWTDETGKSHEGNANAKGKWFDDWLPGGSDYDFITKAYAQILRRLQP